MKGVILKKQPVLLVPTLPKPAPKPAETKPAPKSAEVKPAETKPANTAKPKPTLPKGMEEKPAEVPKPAETTTQPPSTVQAALENAYMNAPMTDLHHYRAKTTASTDGTNVAGSTLDNSTFDFSCNDLKIASQPGKAFDNNTVSYATLPDTLFPASN
jgi:outer membrane biosynthesis protein TonB